MTLISPGVCTLQCGSGIMTVNSPSGSRPSLQSDTRLWDDMSLNSPKRPTYWNSTSGFDFDHNDAVDMSFGTSLQNFSKSDHTREKKMTTCRFSRWRISAILDFRGPIMSSLRSPCTTSYRSSIDTVALNCLDFEKIAFLHFGDRHTDGRTDGRTDEHHRCVKLSRAAA